MESTIDLLRLRRVQAPAIAFFFSAPCRRRSPTGATADPEGGGIGRGLDKTHRLDTFRIGAGPSALAVGMLRYLRFYFEDVIVGNAENRIIILYF